MEIGSIFLGNTPSEQRKFLYEALKYLKSLNYKKVVIPCCGQFAVIKSAIQAGYENSNIHCSDISLFSSLLGYYFSGKDIDSLRVTIKNTEYKEWYDNEKKTLRKIVILIYLLKLNQLRDIYYEGLYKKEMLENKEIYLKQLEKKIISANEIFKGIDYEVKDLRDYFHQDYDKKTIVIINPPAFSKGYTKMFTFNNEIIFDVDVSEFDFKKEYYELYNISKEKKNPFLWYRYKEVKNFYKSEVIFGKEYTKERSDYWLITKPDLLKNFQYKNEVIKNISSKNRPKMYPIFTNYDNINENSLIQFKITDKETALYYREIFAHKLGVTNAETYYLIFIDEKLIGSCGMHGAELRRLVSDNIFEVYCFNPYIEKYPKLNRLMMMYLTCEDFKIELLTTMFKTNRIFTIKGLKTTCLSKYRKVKLNNNLLTITKKEKLPNGLYRLVYETEFYKRTYKDCTKIFLKEQNSNNGKNN